MSGTRTDVITARLGKAVYHSEFRDEYLGKARYALLAAGMEEQREC